MVVRAAAAVGVVPAGVAVLAAAVGVDLVGRAPVVVAVPPVAREVVVDLAAAVAGHEAARPILLASPEGAEHLLRPFFLRYPVSGSASPGFQPERFNRPVFIDVTLVATPAGSRCHPGEEGCRTRL